MAFREASPGHYLMSSTSGDIGGDHDYFRFVCRQLSGDGIITARIDSIREAAEWTRAGIMIRESLDPGSTCAFMSATPEGQRAFLSRTRTGAGATSSVVGSNDTRGFPFWVKLERRGNQFSASYSQDGQTWVAQPGYENTGNAALPNPQTISMKTRGNIFIGLALTSADPQRTTVGAFSDIVVTGDISGSWQVADIGGVNPSNSPGSLYVTLQDASGHRGTLVHPQPDAPLMMEWTEWRIPLADLLALGVDATAVESVALGIDNRDRPAEAGSGLVYLDNITVLHP
jgi:hypothetical protein